MKARGLILISILMVAACGPVNEPAPEPYTREDILTLAWQKYANFEFSTAKQYFDVAIRMNSRDAEGYYGLALSYASLGLRNDAISNAVISLFANYTPYTTEAYVDTPSVLTDTIVLSSYIAFPNRVYKGIYIYHLPKLTRPLLRMSSFRVNDFPAEIVDYGEDYIIASFFHAVLFTNPDSITSSTLPMPGYSVVYSAEVLNVDTLPPVEWNSIVLVENLTYLDQDYWRASHYGYMARLITPDGTLPDRVVKNFTLDNAKDLHLRIFYENSQWYSLAKELHEIDTTWPYPGWGTDMKADVSWSFKNQDAIKSKYFSVIGGP